MIAGGAGGGGVVAFKRLHSTLHVVRKGYPSLSPERLHTHNSAAADSRRHYEVLSSPLPRGDAVLPSAADLPYDVLQQQYLSWNKEGGLQAWWRTGDFPMSGEEGAPVSRRWPISEIAEATGASDQTITDGRQQIGIPASNDEAIGRVDNGFSSEGGDSNGWLKVETVARQAELLKEDLGVSPAHFTSVQGPEAVQFGFICVGLLFVFWLGNYYVPDLIFKSTVFGKDPKDPLEPMGKASGEENVSNQESSKGLTEANNTRDDGSFTTKSGAGFSGLQKRSKSAKRK